MRDVAAFAGFAEAVAFDRLGKNHGRLTFVFDRRFERGVNFLRIVPATLELWIAIPNYQDWAQLPLKALFETGK